MWKIKDTRKRGMHVEKSSFHRGWSIKAMKHNISIHRTYKHRTYLCSRRMASLRDVWWIHDCISMWHASFSFFFVHIFPHFPHFFIFSYFRVFLFHYKNCFYVIYVDVDAALDNLLFPINNLSLWNVIIGTFM